MADAGQLAHQRVPVLEKRSPYRLLMDYANNSSADFHNVSASNTNIPRPIIDAFKASNWNALSLLSGQDYTMILSMQQDQAEGGRTISWLLHKALVRPQSSFISEQLQRVETPHQPFNGVSLSTNENGIPVITLSRAIPWALTTLALDRVIEFLYTEIYFVGMPTVVYFA
ncbi:uncharacterized protein BDZ99DRAFT_520453 [Mytilinidion resinicola]|uniref:Uncharacterized protein n=1 Tax=Mytilinidion resinicola TaxID=574789 RepID=A0A6A6YNR6_9PEZI|nr:uncharacterized protein BDZ99DRAFT_520453 [Mytilinidion resinicola]KAF2810381.1 hypothetical protein BDZ99DRAFT_520453 [Mytilinidion resinicola]